MQLSGKISNILSSNKWYHATTMDGFLSLKQHGVIAKYNQGKPLDFGYRKRRKTPRFSHGDIRRFIALGE